MGLERAAELVELLRSGRLRCRTGIVELPIRLAGQEREIAARLGADCVDYITLLLADAAPNAKELGVEPIREMDRLNRLAMQKGAECLVVANLDFALSRLAPDGVGKVWAELYSRFPKRVRSLVFAMPDAARELFPRGELADRWRRDERWVTVDGH